MLISILNTTGSSTAACHTCSESDWEVSDYLSSDESYDEWLSWRLFLYTFIFTLVKMTSVINKMIFVINKDALFERDAFLSPIWLT